MAEKSGSTKSEKSFNIKGRKSKSSKEKGSLKHVSDIQFKATLSWKDINVYGSNDGLCDCVKIGGDKGKHIIRNVTGEIEYGRIMAIMGSSGAGKTTLLNVLSGREMSGFTVEGTVAINGRVTDQLTIKSLSAYVQQEDIFLANITVKEHLYYQSLLRMDDNRTHKQRSDRVSELMVELDLIRCKDNYIGGVRRKGISGGERKRVALASEIIGNPTILFLDEPTSGLDSHIAEKTVSLLGKLSAGGQTIICTIHQPSSEIFTKFDELLLIAGGRIAYLGPVTQARTFFESQGYTLPQYFNPADVYIRTLAVDSENVEQCNQRNNAICDSYLQSPFAKKVNIDIDKPHFISGKFKATFFTQFFVLLSRTWKNNLRENMFLFIVIEEFISALLFGFVFSRQELNQTGVKNLNNALFFLVITLLYQLCYVEIRMFFEEIDLFYRELDSTLYSVTAYFWAFNIAAVPYQLVAATEFSIVFYFIVGFGGSFTRFANMLLTSVLMSQAVMSFVYLLCCICLNMILAIKVITTLFSLLFLLSGTLIDYATLPRAIYWIRFISFTYLGNEAYIVNQWHKVNNISCEVMRVGGKPRNVTFTKNATDITCYDTGAKVIESFNYDPGNFELDNALLLVLLLGYRILANIALCVRLKRL